MPVGEPNREILHVVDLSPSARTDAVAVDVMAVGSDRVQSTSAVPWGQLDDALAPICDAGRCRVRETATTYLPDVIQWDGGDAWRPDLAITPNGKGGHTLTGVLRRGDETMPIRTPRIIHESGLLLVGDTLARFDHGGAYLVTMALRNFGEIPIVGDELTELLESLFAHPHPPRIALPTDVPIVEKMGTPTPWLTITSDDAPWRLGAPVLALAFEYAGMRVEPDSTVETIFDRPHFTVLHRNLEAERAALERLHEAGARPPIEFDQPPPPHRLTITQSRVPSLTLELVRDGWRVDSAGVRYRAAGEAQAWVTSGIDWFDLDLVMDYDGATATLPQLLAALRNREQTVRLSDGSIGLVPSDWLARIGPAIAAGSRVAGEGVTRFSTNQVALLDALLAALPTVSVDEAFERAREKVRAFEGIQPADPPATFTGTLRAYQREGLGWLHFLRDFGLGGCLADDMGLGKTVQVLALLDEQRSVQTERRPSIVVVPRSLIFNWMREAERFTPKLKVLDYSGQSRRIEQIADHDVVLTTYGTMRSDIAELAAIQFDYAILDEAQAIKNADTVSARASRLIRARHKLALTGTPIENRIEDLWSLFEFLNPGMLGRSPDVMAAGELLRRALRPVILRRTKQQVAPDLPERCEETLYVDMEPAQRDFYLQLLAETRATVFDMIDTAGINRSRMHILEALLRLRQAACHPALVTPAASHLPSAKLDALVPTLEEIIEEGHKAVVFSQFTSFLALVRQRLDAAGLAYEYLDGSTRDRGARVDRFQSDDGPPLFLVSLKAGGHGLNLTAADYVYLLDPWWNPAVEAQAIDRAHRIGQTRPVIATRLVAKGTVEEKVLELQATKRDLADAILNSDQGALMRIGREELELLLG